MKQIIEEDLLNLLEIDVLESQMFSSVYGLAPVNMHIVQERMKIKHMKSLTQSEFEVLKEAEDILFNHVDPVTSGVFDKAFCELYKSLRRYNELEGSDETCQNG
jgi:hypothetical protein